MATIRDYFETDFARLQSSTREFGFRSRDGSEAFEFEGRLYYDVDANAVFMAAYIEASVCTYDRVHAILAGLRVADFRERLRVGEKLGEGQMAWLDELEFAGRVFVYCEQALEEPAVHQLIADARRLFRFAAVFRGPEYAAAKSKEERPLAFISYDSRDKDTMARPIAVGLNKLFCPVWFDEFSLKVGERLRESIERGLAEAARCVVIVTPSYLANTGWARSEFDSIFTRELIKQSDALLPVWHQVTPKEVYEYSPMLANRVALHWTLGSEKVVSELHRAIRRTA